MHGRPDVFDRHCRLQQPLLPFLHRKLWQVVNVSPAPLNLPLWKSARRFRFIESKGVEVIFLVQKTRNGRARDDRIVGVQ